MAAKTRTTMTQKERILAKLRKSGRINSDGSREGWAILLCHAELLTAL